MNIETAGFQLDMRKVYHMAGMRYKPWPKSRKRIRKIRRQNSLQFWKRMNEGMNNAPKTVSIRSSIEHGVPVTIFENPDGTSHVEISMGVCVGGGQSLCRLIQGDSK